MRSIAVVIQACAAPGRSGWESTRASIESSDIGCDYDLRHQPADLSIREHFLDCLLRGAERGADLVLRLEDDVQVNQYILQNLRTWPDLENPMFGCGWAFDPGGVTLDAYHRRWNLVSTKTRWVDRPISGSLATLLWTRDIPAIVGFCKAWFAKNPGPCEQDLALSWAVLSTGRRVAVHAPSLVEHSDFPSQLNHRHAGIKASTSNGSYIKNWRRGEPVLDRYGRKVEGHRSGVRH